MKFVYCIFSSSLCLASFREAAQPTRLHKIDLSANRNDVFYFLTEEKKMYIVKIKQFSKMFSFFSENFLPAEHYFMSVILL